MMDKPFGSRLPDVAATVVIALHNNGSYISAQLESLFAQWQPEFELLLIDDRSTDDGFERVLEMLARHPEVCATVMRSETVGGVGLVDSLLRLARGRVIVQADSDDIALPGRLDAVMACFRSDEDCQLVTSNALLLSPEGRLFGLTETRHASRIFRDPVEVAALARDTRWLGAASAYRRDLFDRFPPIDAELCPPALDMLLPFRAVLLGSHHYLAEPLVGWRQHAGNTHRLTVPGDADATQERYHALFLMIQAQKIRDATFIAAAAPSPVLEQALTLCRQRFDEEFEDWCRARTRASARNSQRAASARAHFRNLQHQRVIKRSAADLQ